MPKPPPSPPSSDIGGANRDARVGDAFRDTDGKSAADLDEAKDDSAGRPDETRPSGESGLDKPDDA